MIFTNKTPLWCALLMALLVSGCATSSKPDLKRLYVQSHSLKQPPVILIHGIMGARLRHQHTREELWPANIWNVMFSNYGNLALAFDEDTLLPVADNIEAYGVTDRIAGEDFYGAIIDTLEGPGQYTRAQPGQPASDERKHYYLFAYDWRQDNTVNAGKLLRFIDQIRLDHGDPALRVDMIAHSMGGLLARYFLRYGEQDVLNDNHFPINLEGAQRVRTMVLLGTPNLGSISSLHAFIRGMPLVYGTVAPETLATFPSIYQLFPHALNDWLITQDGKPLDRDLFDVEVWQRFQWSVFDQQVEARIMGRYQDKQAGMARVLALRAYFAKQLERARRFVWSLTVPLPNQPYKLIVFGGDCELTPARLLVEEVNGRSEIRLFPHEVTQPVAQVNYDQLMLEPGDGTVTKASLLARESLDLTIPRHKFSYFPIDYPLFLCESHDRLTGNISFQDNLLHTLLNLDK